MPASAAFAQHCASYLHDVREARDADRSEHQRKELFLGFLRNAFGVEARAAVGEQIAAIDVIAKRVTGL